VNLMLKNSAILTGASKYSGIGSFILNLNKTHLFERLIYINFDERNNNWSIPYKLSISPFKKWYINTRLSLYMGNLFLKDLSRFNFVFLSDQSIFFISKYFNKSSGILHDFFPLYNGFECKEYRKWVELNLKYMQKMMAVIVPSDYIKKIAEERFPDIQFKRIHHFVSDDFRERDRIEARRMLGLDENKIILLNVSTKDIRKNNELLTRLMNRLDDDYTLLKIGSAEAIIKNLKDKRKLIEVKNVPYDIYPLYFNASDLLIFPSLDEGFGLPVIEAIKSRLPVIASDIPVIREVTWNRVHLVDPLDEEKWVDSILRYSKRENKVPGDLEPLVKYYSIERGKNEYELFLREILNYG